MNQLLVGYARVSTEGHGGVTKLDQLARSLPDARDILDELTRRNDPVGRLLFNVLAMVAELRRT